MTPAAAWLFLLAATPEQRAFEYLAAETARWHRENKCYSCHNNGDAARALYAAHGGRLIAARAPLADTTAFLSQPRRWDENSRGDPRFSDRKLARIQFAAALAEAFRAGLVTDRAALIEAASIVERDQSEDGSWVLDDSASLGAPATYGRAVAAWLARRTLRIADEGRFSAAIARAGRWLAGAPVAATIDASAVILALGSRDTAMATLRANQSSDGGWGPYRNAPSEAFDTALALLALSSLASEGSERLIARGRAWLIAAQLPEGGWVETTRPAGGRSYAQHMSTTGWAAMALVETMKPIE